MLASAIVERARSLSDLPNSLFVSHKDEVNSLNESYKDLYSALIEADDDYYVTELLITMIPGYAVANATNEYLVPLPSDFSKLRYLDYRGGGGDWWPVKKFPMSMKDYNPGDPYYRIRGSNLWIIGGSNVSVGMALRMGYYPPAPTVTMPQADLVYGTSYAPNLFALVTAPGYCPYLETMVYSYNGTGITSESILGSTVSAPVALFTESGAASNYVYWKGILYWLRGGNMWYKAVNCQVPFAAPSQVGAIANVVCFYITADTIYYGNATQIRSCTLTGGSDTLVATVAATSLVAAGPVVIYRTAASVVNIVAPATVLYASSIAKITSDGSGSNVLYLLDNAGQVRRVTYNAITGAILTDEVIDTNAADIGQAVVDIAQSPITTIVPVLKTGYGQLLGIDATVDYNFSFPNNLVPEIMAYQSAVDYRAKQKQDTTELKMRLGHPTGGEGPSIGLWQRFETSIKRDEYQPNRIRNAYPRGDYYR
jgi:hypothetical protein